MGLVRKFALLAGVAATATVTGATAQTGQKVTGPVATYWMSAQTQTGFGLPTGGGNPDPMAMMRQMMGGGQGEANKSLTLQLGSGQTNAEPAADHLPPQALQTGAALPLLTPKLAPREPTNPKVAWNQEWAVKVRYRSATGGLLGMNMAEMMGGDRAARPSRNGTTAPAQPQKPAKPPSAADILRKGILGGGLPFPR